MKIFKKILYILLIIVLFAALGAYFYFATILVRREEAKLCCNNIVVTVKDSSKVGITRGMDILNYLHYQNIELIGRDLRHIPIGEIDSILVGYKSIKDAIVFHNIKGEVHIEVSQHVPKIRLENESKSFYLCEDDFIFPVSNGGCLNIPIVTGNFPLDCPKNFRGKLEKNLQWYRELENFVAFIESDRFWKNQIAQIDVENKKSIDLYPIVGSHVLKIGSFEDYRVKLNRIVSLYKVLRDISQLDKYHVIDASFKGQVVCRLKEEKN